MTSLGWLFGQVYFNILIVEVVSYGVACPHKYRFLELLSYI